MIYLAEKGLALDRVEVDLDGGEQRTPAYLAKNPAGKAPVLELDDGTFLPESAAIVEYLEELYPDPPMIGTTPLARAQVRSIERLMADLYPRLSLYFQHSQPLFRELGRVRQIPAIAEALGAEVEHYFHILEEYNAGREFLAGDRPTVADCTAFPALRRAEEKFGYTIPARFGRLYGWYSRFSERPSTRF